jgi:type IV pilus assembly protein PilM
MSLFSSSNDNLFLGVDIGDSSLKMVELKKRVKKVFLSNYAFSENVKQVNFTKLDDTTYLAMAINKLREESGIKSKKVVASLPTFAVFSSIINLFNVSKSNLTEAIEEEAKKLIPLPLEEMILDWKIIPQKQVKTIEEDKESKEAGKKEDRDMGTRVFITGSPKKLVKKYLEVFKKAKLELISLETETFSLVRALMGNDPSNNLIVEIGANSTDLSIVSENIPVLSRSLDVCGTTITKSLAEKLDLDFLEAEQFKLDLQASLTENSSDELPQLIKQTILPIIQEIEYMRDFFENKKQGKIEKIIISGGGGLLLNLPDYLAKKLDIQTIIGDPFSRIYYPQEIKPVLSEVGSKLAVAVGLAMRGINK